MYAWVNELPDDLQDLCTWRSQPGRIRGLIQRIYDDVDWRLPWEADHFFQALYKVILARLPGATIMSQIEGRKDCTEAIGLIAELNDDGR
jgi:hypothetical protein